MSLRRDLSELSKELRLAGLAAVALVLSLLLPWYEQSFISGGQVKQHNLSAFGAFTFVEAAVLLVALRAVLDYSIERLERPPREAPQVEDIPIR